MVENEQIHVTLRLPDIQENLDLLHLGDFLILLRTTYALCLRAFPGEAATGRAYSDVELRDQFRAFLKTITVSEIDLLFSRSQGDRELTARSIRRESPM